MELTLRVTDPELASRLEAMARDESLSLEAAALSILRRAVGLAGDAAAADRDERIDELDDEVWL